MARKKTLTEVDRFFVRGHAGSLTAADIAAKLKAPVALVEAELDQAGMRAVEDAPKKPAGDQPVKVSGFAVKGTQADKSISVTMTRAQSERGDDLPKTGGDKFLEGRLGKSLHKIRPDEPSR